jgi:hypothetical protein
MNKAIRVFKGFANLFEKGYETTSTEVGILEPELVLNSNRLLRIFGSNVEIVSGEYNPCEIYFYRYCEPLDECYVMPDFILDLNDGYDTEIYFYAIG